MPLDIKCNSSHLSTCLQSAVNMLIENSQDVSSGLESTETIVKVREKAIINKRLNGLTNNMKKAYRTILTWIR